MPQVQVLHQEYADNPDVVVLAMNVGDTNKKAAKYWRDKGYDFRMLHDADKLASEYGVSAFPSSILIGPDGKVLAAQIGSAHSLKGALERSLKDN